ncbi:DBI [Symbiodinium natans]|uniref:DBI protein n=1 Tax=Symbiodinium natans TaxID=878477 RepID=A0A812JIB2_9DINO|nr:DBI [Symbiodinium natans]
MAEIQNELFDEESSQCEEQASGREFPKVKVVAVVAAMLMLAAVGLSTLSTSTASDQVVAKHGGFINLDLQSDFQAAQEKMKRADQSKLTNQQKLDAYAYFKQAVEGDIYVRKPGMFDTKEKMKWEAWNKVKGMATDAAKKKYIDLAKRLS